jgi:hypothetical protein
MQMTWEWIAGFFEGEGHIQWRPPKTNSRQGRGCSLIIGQKDRRPLQMIYDFLKAKDFVNPILYLRPANPAKKRPNPIWILMINRREDTTRFLNAIEPLLIQKKVKALTVMRRLKDSERNTVKVDIEKAIQLHSTGLSWRKIALMMKISYSKLYKSMQKADKKMGKWEMDKDLIRTLKIQGLSITDIANRTGYKEESIKRIDRIRYKPKKPTGAQLKLFTNNVTTSSL